MNISTDFFNSNLGDNTITGVAKGAGPLSGANATNMTGSIQGGFHNILQGAFQGNGAKNQKTESLQTQRREVFVPRVSENSFEKSESSARRSDSNIQSDKRPVESDLIKETGEKVEVSNKKILKASSALDLENKKEGYEDEDVAKNILNVIAWILNLKPEEVEELLETSGIQLEGVLGKIHTDKLTKILNKLRDFIVTGDMNEEKEGLEWSAIQDLLVKVAEGEENVHSMTKTRQNIQEIKEIKDDLLEPLQKEQEMNENKEDPFSNFLSKSKEDKEIKDDLLEPLQKEQEMNENKEDPFSNFLSKSKEDKEIKDDLLEPLQKEQEMNENKEDPFSDFLSKSKEDKEIKDDLLEPLQKEQEMNENKEDPFSNFLSKSKEDKEIKDDLLEPLQKEQEMNENKEDPFSNFLSKSKEDKEIKDDLLEPLQKEQEMNENKEDPFSDFLSKSKEDKEIKDDLLEPLQKEQEMNENKEDPFSDFLSKSKEDKEIKDDLLEPLQKEQEMNENKEDPFSNFLSKSKEDREIKDDLLEPLQKEQEMNENKEDPFSNFLSKSKEDKFGSKDIEIFLQETPLEADEAITNEKSSQEFAEQTISTENLGQTSLEVFSEIMPVDAKREIDGKDLSSNINNQHSQKLQHVTGVTKVTKNEQVFKENIFDQILGKAKVTLAKGKSEMELELKPESLGKLTLKIVTEKGSVVAKVIAENHQVKQLLELSMNELKESLESQGIKLEGFQVDVEQKKENEPRKQEEDGAKEDQKNSRNITKRTVIKSIQHLYTSYNDENDMASGYYVGQEKSINLTA
jgi:flagellar hook-length control protein FliK